MRSFVANTDYDWYRFLSVQTDLDEVNFWRPSGQQPFRYLAFGEPLVFKLKKAHGHAVVGFGLFAAFRRLAVLEAWDIFGRSNGAASLPEMWARVSRYAFHSAAAPIQPTHPIGCILLAPPVFFPEEMWVDGPADWAENTVTGKGYDTTLGEGRRIWQACLDRAAQLGGAIPLEREPLSPTPLMTVDPAARYGPERPIRPRLGQGTFRFAVEAAYGRCAVTGEHSLPALEAAHIVPYGEGGPHELPNGLLLRADVHRLFDAGYVSVSPDYRFRVSGRLRADFSNGRSYYPLDDRPIWVPSDPRLRPDPGWLEQHYAERFLG